MAVLVLLPYLIIYILGQYSLVLAAHKAGRCMGRTDGNENLGTNL